MAAQIDLEILQGSTFLYTLTWYSGKVMKPISGITSAAPAVVTAVDHGLPVNYIPVTITNVKGMRVPSSTLRAKRTSTTQFEVDLDTTALGTYKSGGTLTYHAPVDLSGFSARMQIRKSVADSTVLTSLSTTDGTISLGGLEGTIELSIPASTTTLFAFNSAVYDLELESPSGVVTRLIEGKVALKKEVTRAA